MAQHTTCPLAGIHNYFPKRWTTVWRFTTAGESIWHSAVKSIHTFRMLPFPEINGSPAQVLVCPVWVSLCFWSEASVSCSWLEGEKPDVAPTTMLRLRLQRPPVLVFNVNVNYSLWPVFAWFYTLCCCYIGWLDTCTNEQVFLLNWTVSVFIP